MKMSLVNNEDTVRAVIECAVEKYNEIDIMEDYGMDVNETVQYIKNHCWLVTFYKEDLLAFIILEFNDYNDVNLHFCKLLPGNILQGWKMFIDFTEKQGLTLNAYIDTDKQSVVRIAERFGFEIQDKDKRYCYGKRRRQAKTTTTTTTSSRTSKA
jgi:hypothetical protein